MCWPSNVANRAGLASRISLRSVSVVLERIFDRLPNLRLEDAPYGYEIFRDKKDNCIKIVLRP